jgi:hypothetical protein
LFKFKLWFVLFFFGGNVKFLWIVGIFGDSPLGTNKCATKMGCPLLILVHCILVRVYGLLMNSFMPFDGNLNLITKHSFFYLHFVYISSLLNPPLKGSLPAYLFSSMCITMWWSSPITKHDCISNVLVLFHNHTWLHVILCLFFNYSFFPRP